MSVLVPLVVLALVGHQEWSIYAAFGAMTSLYGRTHVAIPRLRMQGTLAVLLTLAAAGGVAVGLSEHRAWAAVPLNSPARARRVRSAETSFRSERRADSPTRRRSAFRSATAAK